MSHTKTMAVTGATGFVGREVVRALLERGYAVRALIRDREKALSVLPADPRVQHVLGDVLDPKALGELLRGVDGVIHLVGVLRNAGGGQTLRRMHVDATKAVLEAARGANVRRFVHMSALGVSPDGRAEYQRTKFEAEQLVRRSGLDWTIFRPGVIHGPAGELVGLIKGWCEGSAPPFFFVPFFSRLVEHDEGVMLGRVSFETPACAPVAVSDVASAFVASLERCESIGEVYNVVGSESLSFKQMLEFFRDHLPHGDRSLPVVGMPAPVAVAKAELLKAVGLGAMLPFDSGMAWMGSEDSTASLDKLKAHLGIVPAPFTLSAAQYVGALA